MRAQAPRRPGHRAEPCPAPRCTPGHRPCPSAGTHRRGMRHTAAWHARPAPCKGGAPRGAMRAGPGRGKPTYYHRVFSTRCPRTPNTVLPTVLHSAPVHEPGGRTPPPHTRGSLRCWGSVVQARRSLARPAWPRPRSLAPAVHISRCLPACAEARARSLFLPPTSPPPPLSVAAARCGVSLTRRLATRAGRARPRRGFSDGA